MEFFFSSIVMSVFLLITLLSLRFLNKKDPNMLPPGPPKLLFIGNLHQLGKMPHRSLHKLSQKYGPIMFMKLGQVPAIIISSSDMAKQIFQTHDLDCCSRPLTAGTRRLSYNFLDLAFAPYNEYWKTMKKICVTELFSNRKVKSFANLRRKTMESFMGSISGECGKAVNVTEKVFLLLDEIVCQLGCGRSYGGKQFKGGKHVEVINEAMAMLGSFSAEDFFPWVGWVWDVVSGLHGRRERCFMAFDEFYESVIEEHRDPQRPKPEHEDIVDVLLRLSEEQTHDAALTTHHIKAILMNVFLGGIDTSAITITWAMAELIRNPRVMKKLQTEIRSNVIDKPMVEEDDIENLTYFQMVFKETLRLHPPSVLLIPHKTMHQCEIGGYDIAADTRIQVNVWAIGRDPKTWENPDEFFPERFFEKDIDFRGQSYELVPFGAGRRICPALTMASVNIGHTLANLLYRFDWELPDGMKREDVSIEEEVGLTVHKKLPLILVPIRYVTGKE